jgi:asparagine synthetase B (glutamine-hydrolysing)
MLNYKSKNLIYDFKKKKFVTQSHVIKEFKNNKKLHFDGSFSFVKKIKKNFLCCRDKIGSKKVFYGINNKSKKILFSRNFLDLLKKCNIDTIRSIPKGCIVEIGDNGHIIFKKKFEIKKNFRLEKSFQKLLKIYLTQIKKIHGNTCIVCLSSGLDSTIIAYYAKKVFKKVITINLHFNSKNYPTKPIEKVNSSKIAELLNTNHKNISISFEEIFSDLNKIIYSCQDWRDFNVHCAFLNYAIAKYIKKNNLNYPVLTGDLMNEYFADY